MQSRRNTSKTRRNETPKQFILKTTTQKRSHSNNHSLPSSLNTSHSTSKFSVNDRNHPEDGKLLELLIEHENQQLSQIFNVQLSTISIMDDETKQKYAISLDDPNNPQLRRNLTYNWYYHQENQTYMYQENISISNSLNKQGIKQYLRAKMVDWILEVYGNFSNTTTHQTFFRAVCIMDLFLKKTQQLYQDQDLHLIGIVCMFISTKVEDIYHIPLNDFVSRVSHNKFPAHKIKALEAVILDVLNYQIYFLTPLDHLQYVYYKCFSLNDNPQLINIYETCIYILKMCMHDYPVLSIPQHILSAAVFGYGIKEYIETKQDGTKQQLSKITKTTFEAMVKLLKLEFNQFNDAMRQVTDLINQFKQKYPDLVNLEKFS